jgi:kynurenine formamidase
MEQRAFSGLHIRWILPYAQIERLVNLKDVPVHGFKIACFPLKIKGGSAGPARVVAIVEN